MEERQKDYFPDETPEKTFGFKFILTLVAIMIMSIIGIRIYTWESYSAAPDPTLQREPVWYFWSVIILGILALIGLLYTYQYKKWGVYLVILSLFLMVVINPNFSLMITLAPLFTLFVFVGYGLFEIIPKWKYFT